MSHNKFGPDRFSRFDVYCIQTNRQTNRQTSQIYIQNRRKKRIERGKAKSTEIKKKIVNVYMCGGGAEDIECKLKVSIRIGIKNMGEE